MDYNKKTDSIPTLPPQLKLRQIYKDRAMQKKYIYNFEKHHYWLSDEYFNYFRSKSGRLSYQRKKDNYYETPIFACS